VSRATRSDRFGLAGYGCLVGLLAGGLLGGAALVFLGVAGIVRGSGSELASAREAWQLQVELETALVLVAAGCLGLLVGVVAGVVLLKELGDEAARRERGPLR